MAYRGFTVELPLNQGGQHGARNPSQIPPTHLVRALNCTFENGTLQKEGGAVRYNATAITGTPSIIGGHDWWPDSNTQRAIVYTGAALLRDTGTGDFATTLASGLSASDTCVFVAGGQEAAARARKLFIFTETNQVRVLSGDGTTVTTIAAPPADWTTSFPSFGAIHEGRLFAGGNPNDPHRLYYSTTGDHENFTGTGSGSLSIYPGEGQRLIGAVSFKGLLIVWKYPTGIYLVDVSTISSPVVKRHTASIGSGSPQAISIVEDDVIFVDQVGQLQQLSAVQEFGSVGSRNLSDVDQLSAFLRDEMDLVANLKRLRSVYYPRKRELHFAMPAAGSAVNDRRVVLDFNKPNIRWRVSDRDVCESMWLRQGANGEQQLVAGDNAGVVWLLDQETKDKNGAAYSAQIQTPETDFSFVDPALAGRIKLGQFLEIISDAIGAWDITVEVYWDGNLVQTIVFGGSASGSALGSFTLDTSALAGATVLSERRRLEGSGKYLSLVFSNNNAGEDFSIARVLVSFKVGDEG